jgi:hypothetical protein
VEQSPRPQAWTLRRHLPEPQVRPQFHSAVAQPEEHCFVALVCLKPGLTIFRDSPATQLVAGLNFAQAAAQVALSAVEPQAAPPQRSTKKSSCRPLPDERSHS